MNLYLTTAGVYAGTQKDAGKGHTAVEVPTDKAGLIAYLNADRDAMLEIAGTPSGSPIQAHEDLLAPEAQSDMTKALLAGSDDYQSPLSARTVIAGIDAGMVASAVRQFDGPNLAKVVTATIERMRLLAMGITA